MEQRYPAIPTLFRGTRYRSDLEARWAVMALFLGWQTTYESVAGRGYIPDFTIHIPNWAPILAEVKPVVEWSAYQEVGHAMEKRLDGWRGHLMVLGARPWLRDPLGSDGAIGIFGNDNDVLPARNWLAARVVRCELCNVSTVEPMPRLATPCIGPCRHGWPETGDLPPRYARAPDFMEPPTRRWLEWHWGWAGNVVRWEPKRPPLR